MADDDVTRGPEPMDRLTGLCDQMTRVLDYPENEDVRAIVFLDDGERGGIQLHGYTDDVEAMAALFVHMQAVFRANGRDIQFVGIPDSPEGL
jgi:hypothetical protein